GMAQRPAFGICSSLWSVLNSASVSLVPSLSWSRKLSAAATLCSVQRGSIPTLGRNAATADTIAIVIRRAHIGGHLPLLFVVHVKLQLHAGAPGKIKPGGPAVVHSTIGNHSQRQAVEPGAAGRDQLDNPRDIDGELFRSGILRLRRLLR